MDLMKLGIPEPKVVESCQSLAYIGDRENPNRDRTAYGRTTPPSKDSIKVLGCVGDNRGPGWYRMKQPSIYINGKHGDRFCQISTETINNFDIHPRRDTPTDFKWDIAVWQRAHLPNVLSMAQDMKLFNKTIHIYEADDDYTCLDKKNPSSTMFASLYWQTCFRDFLKNMDALIVSTEYLKRTYEKKIKDCPPVYVAKNSTWVDMIEFQLTQKNILESVAMKARQVENGELVIGYAGSGSHYSDLEFIAPVILDVLKKYPNVKFQLQGCIDYPFFNNAEFKEFESRIIKIPWVNEIVLYHLIMLNVDINICPLAPFEFNKSKSNIKAQQSMIMGVPCICTNEEAYREIYAEGAPIKLIEPIDPKNPAAGQQAWFKTISKYIEDKALRNTLSIKGKAFVKEKYDQKNMVKQWVDIYETLLKGAAK